ncbi:hypothetical protein VH98_03505 [Acinetobacter brisouii]|nr:hypothetical protein VH98_03505 [Acinetobacter brisouii]
MKSITFNFLLRVVGLVLANLETAINPNLVFFVRLKKTAIGNIALSFYLFLHHYYQITTKILDIHDDLLIDLSSSQREY